MRNRIQEYHLENFEYRNGSLEFSCPKLELTLKKGQAAEGSFFIQGIGGKKLEGYIITNGSRLECLNNSFRENEAEIFYRIDSAGLEEGTVIKGDINVISDRGEYSLPYVVNIQPGRVESSLGTVKNLFHFTNLAKTNWKEAVELFYTPGFSRIFQGSDRQFFAVYRGFSYLPGNDKNVEQFLIEVHKKQAVTYSVEKEEVSLKYIGAELEESITVKRSGWGYTYLQVECDGEFLEPSAAVLLEKDFFENQCELKLRVKEDRLHTGNNFGEIRLCCGPECIKIPVKIQWFADRRRVSAGKGREKKELTFKIMKDYLAFRLHQAGNAVWQDAVMEDVDRLILLGEREVVPRLYQAQLLITKGNMHEAQWVLDHVETVLDGETQNNEIWCYYLYLTALCNTQPAYVSEIKEEISSAHRANPDNWRISWLMLHMEPGYRKSPSKKWVFLEEQFQKGCVSPVLYIEAVCLLTENTSLLMKLEQFEFQVLWFAAKYHALSKDMIHQLHYLVSRTRTFSGQLYRILAAGYETSPDVITLEAICTLLIKGGRSGEQYFKWFELGVKEGLRITLLYEYYMMSIPPGSADRIPRMVMMYFAYQNNLEYQKCAMLYARVWREREENPELFKSYGANIERFVVEQLRLGHVNHDLAYLYKNLLTPDMLTPELGQKLIPVLFSHFIRVHSRKIVKVILIYGKRSGELSYPVIGQTALVPIYGSDYKLFLEDGEGNRYAQEELYLMEKLMVAGKLVKEVLPYALPCEGGNLDFALYLSEHGGNFMNLTSANVRLMQEIVESDRVLPSIKREMTLRLLHFYFEQDMLKQLDEILLKIQDVGLNVKERSDVIKYMIVREMYDSALSWIKKAGVDGLDPKVIVRLCSRVISQEEVEEDSELTQIIYYAYKKGKYDETILRYLIGNFEGPIKEMRNIWKSAKEFLVEVFPICEKMIEQMLFTGSYIAERMQVYADYWKGPADAAVEHAFLLRCSYEYFVKNHLPEDEICGEIVRFYSRQGEVHTLCQLAFLKYFYENKKARNMETDVLAEKFLRELLMKNIYFAFFLDYQKVLPDLSRYADRTVLEYRTNPDSKVVLHYMIEREGEENSRYRQEVMHNMYAGIFSKSFVLFFGECLQYYITEEVDRKEQLTESGTIRKSDITAESGESRFSIVNDIAIAKTLRDYNTFDQLTEEYYRKNDMTEKLFTII